jgi:hypothetical protein
LALGTAVTVLSPERQPVTPDKTHSANAAVAANGICLFISIVLLIAWIILLLQVWIPSEDLVHKTPFAVA